LSGNATTTSGDGGSLTATDVATAIENGCFDLVLEEGMSVELKNPRDFEVWWGLPTQRCSQQAGLLVSWYSANVDTPAKYQAYKPNPVDGDPCSGFFGGDFTASDTGGAPTCGEGNVTFANHVDNVPDPFSAAIVRIKALYNSTVIRVRADGQVRLVRSAATNRQDNQARVVEVRETQPGAPLVMDYALFAGAGNIEKN
jgi:hypothetical protein